MLYAIVAVIVLIIDQAVKYWTNLELAVGAVKEFIPGVFQLTYVQNTGAAFGLLDGGKARWILVALTVVFTGALIYLLAKKVFNGKFGPWMLIMVLAGGIGNCIDRIINGYVVDTFQFIPKIFGYEFPVFNVADIFITLGGIAFCLWLILCKEPLAEKAPKDDSPHRSVKPVNADYIEQLANPGAPKTAPAATPAATRRPAASPEARRPVSGEARRPATGRSTPTQRREVPSAGRPAPAPRPQFVDPFEEFMNKTEPLIRPTPPARPDVPAKPASPTRTEPTPQTQPERVPQPEPATIPQPSPAPQTEPAPQRVTDINTPSGTHVSASEAQPKAVPAGENSAPKAEATPEVAPKKQEGFSLEDILAEFK